MFVFKPGSENHDGKYSFLVVDVLLSNIISQVFIDIN